MSELGLLVVGSANMDLVVRAPQFPLAGETLGGGELEFHPGGKGANQAVAAARAGARVAFVGRVGEDPFGDRLVGALKEAGVCCAALGRSAGSTTGTALILVDSNTGENRILLARGANGEVQADDARSALDAGDYGWLLLQCEIADEVGQAVARRARERGLGVTLNPAPAPAADRAPSWAGLADHLVVNETEAARLLARPALGAGEEREALGALRTRYGAREVTLTLGARGAIHWGEMRLEVAAPATAVLDTTAAGDAFVGFFEAARCHGVGVEEALLEAVVAGSLACSRRGAQASIPDRSEVQGRRASVRVHRW